MAPTSEDPGLNIGWEAVSRHARGTRRDKVAIRWLGGRQIEADPVVDLTYGELDALTNRFANVLAALGVRPGDRVYALCSRIPELYVAALGTLKHRAVFCPLFSAFGPEPIRERLVRGDGRVLVTTERLYAKKVAAIRAQVPSLEHVLVIGKGGRPVDGPDCIDLRAALAAASSRYTVQPTDPEDMALLHFTSGTTGQPKGVVHVHQAVRWHEATARLALDLGPDDIFWCTADPGWVTGTSYGIIAPLVLGCTMIVDEAEFDAARWYRTLARERVTVWYTAPTAVRMLMRIGMDEVEPGALSSVRFVASVGEPLNPEAVRWGEEAWGLPIHDNWWQSETGGICIANVRGAEIRPGSMGKPLPGIEAAVVRHLPDGHVEVIADADEEGELALRPGWPSMFRTYLHNEERYRRCFRDGWYLTGDLATIDADGYVWFVGRADDVIKSAGHLIGPFEVESALIEHPAVAEAAVIGKPDPVAGAIVKAFVALNPGHRGNEDLVQELLGFARKRLGAAIAPREITIVDDLPRTRSGKIMRRLLKARELGLDEGDTSTLETPA